MTSAIVVGTGIAGLTFALHAARRGVDVTLVSKAAADEGSTRLAQGGIAGAVFAADRISDHARDTLAAGAGLCDEAAVHVLVSEGPARVRELAGWGIAFDRDADGRLRGGLEAAHSFPRILHAGGDATGLAIESALLRAAREAGIRIIEHAFLTGIVMSAGRANGVRLLREGRSQTLTADAIVLATGGAGRLFSRTTNPRVATGDGIAAALRAGAEVRDLEFVQFHPTVLAAGSPFLISEAVRGEGATLIDDEGNRFALDAHPDGELAPRDVVARAVAACMAAQGGRPVRLDATRVPRLRERFPSIDAAMRERGLDWTREPVPVTPAAHYLMGGVRTDLHARTTLPGLYAIGETARTGVHGANRLASNSLLEGAVFGARAAADVARGGGDHPLRATSPARAEASGDILPFSREALQELMWAHAGLIRDADGLRLAADTIAAWCAGRPAPRTVAEHEDDNLLLVAQSLVAAALARPASVGAHCRSDDMPRSPLPVPALSVPSGAAC
ncbi:L-aspartate oxidase [Microbacterium sp. NPDC096154]|uniref:L-aspartate oxidase n=1 Tax=Microbacterium sp. NPDC096154 TaxID=3155549 RepID=UPI00332C9879